MKPAVLGIIEVVERPQKLQWARGSPHVTGPRAVPPTLARSPAPGSRRLETETPAPEAAAESSLLRQQRQNRTKGRWHFFKEPRVSHSLWVPGLGSKYGSVNS